MPLKTSNIDNTQRIKSILKKGSKYGLQLNTFKPKSEYLEFSKNKYFSPMPNPKYLKDEKITVLASDVQNLLKENVFNEIITSDLSNIISTINLYQKLPSLQKEYSPIIFRIRCTNTNLGQCIMAIYYTFKKG